MEQSQLTTLLDPLDDDDPFFLSFLAELSEQRVSASESLIPEDSRNQLKRIGASADKPPKKRKLNEDIITGTSADVHAGGTNKISSSSSVKSTNGRVTKKIILPVTHLSAKSCRFVKTRGEVRGDTLISLEKLTNVVADKINDPIFAATSGGSSTSECVEVVSRTLRILSWQLCHGKYTMQLVTSV